MKDWIHKGNFFWLNLTLKLGHLNHKKGVPLPLGLGPPMHNVQKIENKWELLIRVTLKVQRGGKIKLLF